MAGSRAAAEDQNAKKPSFFEKVFKPKVDPYQESKEKRSTLEQVREGSADTKTKKALETAGVE